MQNPESRRTLANARLQTLRRAQYQAVQAEAADTFRRKNADYGDAFAKYGPVGVIVRIEDKMARLRSVERNKIALVNDETMRDTLLDLHNYAAMAIMLLDEKGSG